MSIQFSEYYHSQTGLTVGINRILFSQKTDYQLVEVFETDSWGNLMTIDGMVMLSEKDEFVYHEMLSHVALFTHPHPETVLIIGGGDGGTAREVMKHRSVRRVDLVEIDETVVEASRQYLPAVGDFDNPKLHVVYGDGVEYVENCSDNYDLIIIDGSDPVGPAEGLHQKNFCLGCFRLLSERGVMVSQTESPWISSYQPGINKMYSILNGLFLHTAMYLCHIPLYPSGMWSMMIASKETHPLDEPVITRVKMGMDELRGLKYYNSDIHKASFALPSFVRNIL